MQETLPWKERQSCFWTGALLKDIDQILEEMVYIQFAEVEDFLELMVAAQALPHTDFQRYPTVMKKIQERQAKKENVISIKNDINVKKNYKLLEKYSN